MVGKKKVKAAAPKTCVKKVTLTVQKGCQVLDKFCASLGRFVTNNKTYAAAAQENLAQPAPKPAPLIDLVSSSSSSEICIIDDAAKSQGTVIATTTSTAAKAATSSDDSAPNASTSRGSCYASSPIASTSRGLNPDEDQSNEFLKNGTANTSSSPTTPPHPPSKRRPDDEDAPPQKRRRVNSSKSNVATAPASTPSTVCTATSSTPTPSSSTSPSSSNGLTINTTLYEKLAEGFKEIEVGKDGACFFRACSHQEYGTEERHQEFRDAAQQYFDANRDELEHQILALHGGTFQQFLDEQKEQKTFADYFDVSAIANVYGIRIIVYRPDSPASVFDPVNGVTDPSKKPYLLAFVNNNHYNSIIPVDQECNTDENLLNGAATSLIRSDESIAMDYVTPRRTLPARRSKFAKAPVIDNVSDNDSVFEDYPMQSDDDYEMDDDDGSMQSDGDSVIADELSDNQPSTTISETVNNVNEESSNTSSPSPSTTGAAKKDHAKLTADEKLLLQLNEEFLKLYRRREYFRKNNERPQFPYGLEYKVLAMLFFHSKSKGSWWALPEITKWIKDKFLHFKNLKSTKWNESLREILKRPSNKMFSMRGGNKKVQFSFIGSFPDIGKDIVQLSQLSASPKKSFRKTPIAYEKYAKDFVYYHQHQKYFSKHNVQPSVRTGGLILYFFFVKGKEKSYTLRDITRWMEDNIVFYKSKPNETWHSVFQSFLKKNDNVFLKSGKQRDASYTFNGSFPEVDKDDIDRDPNLIQPAITQQEGADTYIHSLKTMQRSIVYAVQKDDDFIYFHQRRDFFSKNNVKPELQFGVIIRYLFSQKPVGTWFTLKEIYTWITDNILYYKNQNDTWKSTVRNYLLANRGRFQHRYHDKKLQYSYDGKFPEVNPNDIIEESQLSRKPLFTKYADQPIIENWKYTNETQKEIEIEGRVYYVVNNNRRVNDSIKYLYCVDCSCKNGQLAYKLGQFQPKVQSTICYLQLKDGVVRGNHKDNHLCEDKAYADCSGRKQFGMFAADDPEKYIESLEDLADYMTGLMHETAHLSILNYVPKNWLQYDENAEYTYLYGLSYSDDIRSFWYIGISTDPWERLRTHKKGIRRDMFKNADGSEREVYMTILLCMPSLHLLAYELEATLISYGLYHHEEVELPKPLDNGGNGTWKNRAKSRNTLKAISKDPDHVLFSKVGRALRELLDDGAARGPRISSFAIGLSGELKEQKKEYRRLKAT